MPRKPREDEAGAIHHVFARGNDRRTLFRDDIDRVMYLELLGATVVRFEWRCLSYCLMGTHIHLLIETAQANLGVGMQRIHGRYAELFNARHGRSGHVFQGRYGAVRVRSDAQLHAVAGYIDRNPIEAGIASSATWPWGSAGTLASETQPPWLAHDRLVDLLMNAA
jgi:REP element-mobilizing transposase RayT